MAKKEITVDVLDIKVGTITRAWEHPGADKLWVESIDVGEAKERQVVSGLRAFKTKEQMEGARVLVLCNVKKGPLRDEMSEGMVMCASDEAHTTVDFVVPPAGAPNGERVRFAGFEGEPVEVLVPKKKMFEACAPKLRTNDEGVACYDGVPFMTSAGACASSLKQAFIK
jgi:aminoacyl tRNA synthase complex-interacting multifunctional protein 1